jgi:hypothetical protein
MPGLRASRFALAITASCLLAGCAHTHVVKASGTVNVGLSEYRLNPQDIRVRAGRVTIFVRNYGRLTHNLVVSRSGQTTNSTGPLLPGEGAQLALDLAPGNYAMASTILSDQALGAYGTLTVTR